MARARTYVVELQKLISSQLLYFQLQKYKVLVAPVTQFVDRNVRIWHCTLIFFQTPILTRQKSHMLCVLKCYIVHNLEYTIVEYTSGC